MLYWHWHYHARTCVRAVLHHARAGIALCNGYSDTATTGRLLNTAIVATPRTEMAPGGAKSKPARRFPPKLNYGVCEAAAVV